MQSHKKLSLFFSKAPDGIKKQAGNRFSLFKEKVIEIANKKKLEKEANHGDNSELSLRQMQLSLPQEQKNHEKEQHQVINALKNENKVTNEQEEIDHKHNMLKDKDIHSLQQLGQKEEIHISLENKDHKQKQKSHTDELLHFFNKVGPTVASKAQKDQLVFISTLQAKAQQKQIDNAAKEQHTNNENQKKENLVEHNQIIEKKTTKHQVSDHKTIQQMENDEEEQQEKFQQDIKVYQIMEKDTIQRSPKQLDHDKKKDIIPIIHQEGIKYEEFKQNLQQQHHSNDQSFNLDSTDKKNSNENKNEQKPLKSPEQNVHKQQEQNIVEQQEQLQLSNIVDTQKQQQETGQADEIVKFIAINKDQKNVVEVNKEEKLREIARKKRLLEMQLLEINQEILHIQKEVEVNSTKQKVGKRQQSPQPRKNSPLIKEKNQVKAMIEISDDQKAMQEASSLVKKMNIRRKQKQQHLLDKINSISGKISDEMLMLREQRYEELQIIQEQERKNIVISRMQEHELKKLEVQRKQIASKMFVQELQVEGPRRGIISKNYLKRVNQIEKDIGDSLMQIKSVERVSLIEQKKRNLFSIRNLSISTPINIDQSRLNQQDQQLSEYSSSNPQYAQNYIQNSNLYESEIQDLKYQINNKNPNSHRMNNEQRQDNNVDIQNYTPQQYQNNKKQPQSQKKEKPNKFFLYLQQQQLPKVQEQSYSESTNQKYKQQLQNKSDIISNVYDHKQRRYLPHSSYQQNQQYYDQKQNTKEEREDVLLEINEQQIDQIQKQKRNLPSSKQSSISQYQQKRIQQQQQQPDLFEEEGDEYNQDDQRYSNNQQNNNQKNISKQKNLNKITAINQEQNQSLKQKRQVRSNYSNTNQQQYKNNSKKQQHQVEDGYEQF